MARERRTRPLNAPGTVVASDRRLRLSDARFATPPTTPYAVVAIPMPRH
jgi:hypothetical protein